MNSSNPQQPQAAPAQPIHDVAPPPADSLGNPEGLANIPVHQAPGEQPPAAAQASAPAQATQAQPQAEDIDKVLKDVNKDVKAEDKPKKPQKTSSNKPVLVITMAIIIGLVLSAAAYYAYNSAT